MLNCLMSTVPQVVMFDSCNSASGTRDDECQARGVTLPLDYAQTAGLGKDSFINESGANSGRASSTTPDNHVLLAACREDRRAFETATLPRHGAFTAALMEKLREPSSAFLTYDELTLSLHPSRFILDPKR